MNREYGANGQRITLETDGALVAVRFRESTSQRAREGLAERAGAPFAGRHELPGEKFTIFPLEPAADPAAAGHALDVLQDPSLVSRLAPVFRMGRNRVVATNRLLVGVRSPDVIDAVAQAVNGTLLPYRCGQGEFLLQLPEDVDPLDASDHLVIRQDVDFAEPDFVTIGRHIPHGRGGSSTVDRLSGFQYMLDVTRAAAARALVTADRSIRIAVLDDGLYTKHPDLAAAIVGQYDAVRDNAFQEPNGWDTHGTACAGLAAGAGHHRLGVEGIGSGCSLLAVRVACSAEPGAPWKTSNSVLAGAIDWAWRNHASVLSSTWGGSPPSTAVARAVSRARTMGRGGLGAVVVVAAGDDNGPVMFPADSPGVLAVAASNEFDEPKTPTSLDGESWWGSCYGPQIALAAPGVHHYTTGVSARGDDGLDRAALDYLLSFNGTASACPIVAGAAALALSAHPSLTEAQVRRILTETADKVGSVPYVEGRNDRMGFGRVNVARAVAAAIRAAGRTSLSGAG